MRKRVEAIGAWRCAFPLKAVQPCGDGVVRCRGWVVVRHRHTKHAGHALRVAKTCDAASRAAKCDGHASVGGGVASFVDCEVAAIEALHAGAVATLRRGEKVRAIRRASALRAGVGGVIAACGRCGRA